MTRFALAQRVCGRDFRTMKTAALFLCAAFLLLLSVTGSWAQSFQGTGNNFGSGWRSDGNGGYQGTGNNFGGGWRSDGNGGYTGTGNNFGSGWRSDGSGGFQGSGNGFGEGWRRN